MPHYGILREYKLEDVDDVRGADVYGVNDEKLGTIDDVIFDHSNGEIRYIVLKTSGLLSSKRTMVPANRIEPYGNHDDKFYAELDKERLEMLPEFNDEVMKSESDWADFENEYEERWKDGTVMYNQDTGRIITPPAEEQPQTSELTARQANDIATRNLTPERLIKTPGHKDDYLGVASGAGKTTLHPKKPSIAGRESVAGGEDEKATGRESGAGISPPPTQKAPTQKVGGALGAEFQASTPTPASPMDAIREPGIYRLDAVPETGPTPEAKRDVNESPNPAPNADYGPRWMQFQQKLRERRDHVVSGCNLCGTQDKAA